MKEYSDIERAWLWVNDSLGANVRTTEQLVNMNGGVLQLYGSVKGSRGIRLPARIPKRVVNTLREHCSEAYIDGFISDMEKKGIHAVVRGCADYPKLIAEIADAPSVLYVKGRLKPSVKLPIAIIGSRNCSNYGREMAGFFGRRLAEHGCCIVSGLAMGCDAWAATGAVNVDRSDYPSIAVLGCGVDVVYPYTSALLYERVLEKGAIISEFKPGTQPLRAHFPQRNRLISGSSLGVLVIEAAAQSGTSITVDFAHEQGRDVFAVPGRITDPMSAGTNELIKSGAAKAVFDVDDILYEYGIFLENAESPLKTFDLTRLTYGQRIIYKELQKGETSIDKLCDATGFSVSDVNTFLTEMELSGIIKQLPNGEYSV